MSWVFSLVSMTVGGQGVLRPSASCNWEGPGPQGWEEPDYCLVEAARFGETGQLQLARIAKLKLQLGGTRAAGGGGTGVLLDQAGTNGGTAPWQTHGILKKPRRDPMTPERRKTDPLSWMAAEKHRTTRQVRSKTPATAQRWTRFGYGASFPRGGKRERIASKPGIRREMEHCRPNKACRRLRGHAHRQH